jgi:hypothetical protein
MRHLLTQQGDEIPDASPGAFQELAAAGSDALLDQPPAPVPLLGAALPFGAAAAPQPQSSLSIVEILGPQPLSSAKVHKSIMRHTHAAFILA